MSQYSGYKEKYAVYAIHKYFYNIPIDTKAYVVAKCYLCSENKRYTDDGEIKRDYDVVFSWDPNNDKENSVPILKPLTDKVVNSTTVEQIYDTPQECQKKVDQLNKQLILDAKLLGDEKAKEIAEQTTIANQHLKKESNINR